VATLEIDPLVNRVRDAVKDLELPTTRDLPSFDEFAKDLRRFDAPKVVDQVTKAIERIDIPKAIERVELPAAIEQRLPGRRRRRAPLGLFGLIGLAVGVVATIALFPPARRRLRVMLDGLREQVDGLRGEQHWSRVDEPTAFPANPTMPLPDDPMIPGRPAPYPDGLGDGTSAPDDIPAPMTETMR
jgi:hypothetical protein